MYALFVFVLFSCRPPCEITIVDNGKLADSALRFVPYSNGETYSFKHSNGHIINYTASRETIEAYSSCSECCVYEYRYEVNTTKLIPDYPLFNLQFEIDNFDTTDYHLRALVGSYFFYIPINEEFNTDYVTRADSIMIDSLYYYQVFTLKSYSNNFFSQDSIFVDSLYYNYDKGVVKIIMSNEESYTLCK